MKVLYFVHTYLEKNGISQHVASLVKNMPQGVETKVISGGGSSLPLFSSLRVPTFEFLKLFSENFDIIHVHGYGNFFSFFGAMAAIFRRKPLVWTIHGYPKIHGPRRVFYYVYRYLMAPFIFFAAKKIIAVSSESAQLLNRETSKPALVMPNGVDLELFRPAELYKKMSRVCYVGRLDPDKGVERMLECTSFPVAFIGPDEDNTKEKLEKLAAGAGRKVYFEQVPFEKMPEKYGLCRYVVLPSKYEGFPLTLLESIATCRPFISTDVGEVGKVLSELFDHPDKYILAGNLQQKIDELEKLDLEEELGAARKNAQKYSWKNIALDLSKIYAEVCPK